MICKIEKLVFHNEEVWMIKISEKAVPDIIVQFAALHLGVIETMMLIDKATGCTIHIYHDAKESKVKYKIGLNKEQHPISQTSLEAMVALMTRVAINGWSDTAHIDIEINEYISLCFAVELPSQ